MMYLFQQIKVWATKKVWKISAKCCADALVSQEKRDKPKVYADRLIESKKKAPQTRSQNYEGVFS